MTIPLFCVAIALALIYVTKAPVAVAMGKQPRGYDNNNPRDQQASLEGWGRSMIWAVGAGASFALMLLPALT